jgi:hypothetical protein
VTPSQLESLLPDGWELDEHADPETREMVLRVMGAVAEYMAGDLDDAGLRDRLIRQAGWVVVTSYSSASEELIATTRPPATAFVAGTALLAGSG